MKKFLNIINNKLNLNNQGWGLLLMLAFSACLLIALLVSFYLIYMLYSSLGI